MTISNSSINRQRRAAVETENVTRDIYPFLNDDDLLEQEYGLRPAGVPARATATNSYRQRNTSGPQQNFRPARYVPNTEYAPRQTTSHLSHGNNVKAIVFKKEKRRFHWLVPVGTTLLIAVIACWFLGTIGASWWTDHFSDTYGPTHGSMLTVTVKAGEQPEQIIGINNNGIVTIFIEPANPKNARIFPGPDLKKQNFPQANKAVVLLSTGDFNQDGNTDIEVTILSNTFSEPFHRITATYKLMADGKGSFISDNTAVIG